MSERGCAGNGCLGIVAIGIVGALFVAFVNSQSGDAPHDSRAPAQPSAAAVAVPTKSESESFADEYLSVRHAEWRRGGFDTVLVGDLSIKNASTAVGVKDVKLLCIVAGESGTIIDHATLTLYSVIPPKKTKRFHGVNLGFASQQVTKAACKAVDATLMP